jgi:hypothetical protein
MAKSRCLAGLVQLPNDPLRGADEVLDRLDFCAEADATERGTGPSFRVRVRPLSGLSGSGLYMTVHLGVRNRRNFSQKWRSTCLAGDQHGGHTFLDPP